MKCDFSRTTFHPASRYSRVLMQQGRVQLDADWNEQVAIHVHQQRALAHDLIGPFGGPQHNLGFQIIANAQRSGDFTIERGHYYVDGVLCENPETTTFLLQPDLPGLEPLAPGAYAVYLDVWEREITSLQDEHIREVALGGADTAARARVVWQVRAERDDGVYASASDARDKVEPRYQSALARGKLRAQVLKPANSGGADPCLVASDARYRGFENQLYRVEVQSTKPLGFRWSRDNGSVTFPVISLVTGDGKTVVRVEHVGRDERSGLASGDWIEVADDRTALDPPETSKLLQVLSVDRTERTVTLQGTAVVGADPRYHPLLRRWDHRQGTPLTASGMPIPASGSWVDLEEGIQVQFEYDQAHPLRVGDYWLIPARTAKGGIEWPEDEHHDPLAREPHGIVHHRAPLAYLQIVAGGASPAPFDLRRQFTGLAQPI